MEVRVGGRVDGGLEQRLEQTLNNVLETLHRVVDAVNVIQSGHLNQPSDKYEYVLIKY